MQVLSALPSADGMLPIILLEKPEQSRPQELEPLASVVCVRDIGFQELRVNLWGKRAARGMFKFLSTRVWVLSFFFQCPKFGRECSEIVDSCAFGESEEVKGAEADYIRLSTHFTICGELFAECLRSTRKRLG